MTREEAIKNIKEHCYFANLIPQAKEALDMAIEALSAEPCKDAVSREEAKKAMFDLCGDGSLKENPWRDNPNIDAIIDALDNMQPVKPKERTGSWNTGYSFPDGAYWRCSCCGELIKVKFPMNYCNNCGAKMERGYKE